MADNLSGDPYDILERAIADKDSDKIVQIDSRCDNQIYLTMVLSDFDNVLTHGSDDLLYHLGNRLITFEYAEAYNKLYIVNEFRRAVRDKDDDKMMKLFCIIKQSITLPYIAKRLDILLQSVEIGMLSSLATCFVRTEYQTEYQRVCREINRALDGSDVNGTIYRGGTLSHVPIANAAIIAETDQYSYGEGSSSSDNLVHIAARGSSSSNSGPRRIPARNIVVPLHTQSIPVRPVQPIRSTQAVRSVQPVRPTLRRQPPSNSSELPPLIPSPAPPARPGARRIIRNKK